MSKAFIDTNLLVYLATSGTDKAEKVKALVINNKELFISIQILNEFTAVCFKKKLLSFEEIKRYVDEFNLFFTVVPVNFKTISTGFEIKKKYKYSWYDCLIVATALINNCTSLYTEDLQHKQKIENKLTIINPLLG